MFFSTSESFWHAKKNLVKRHQEVGFGQKKKPPPQLGIFFPHNPVFLQRSKTQKCIWVKYQRLRSASQIWSQAGKLRFLCPNRPPRRNVLQSLYLFQHLLETFASFWTTSNSLESIYKHQILASKVQINMETVR